MTSQNFHYRLGKGPSAGPRTSTPLSHFRNCHLQSAASVAHSTAMIRGLPGISWLPAFHAQEQVDYRSRAGMTSHRSGPVVGRMAPRSALWMLDTQHGQARQFSRRPFAKKGTASPRVARCGTAGWVRWTAVRWVSSRPCAGTTSAYSDTRLSAKDWVEDAERCRRAHIPEEARQAKQMRACAGAGRIRPPTRRPIWLTWPLTGARQGSRLSRGTWRRYVLFAPMATSISAGWMIPLPTDLHYEPARPARSAHRPARADRGRRAARSGLCLEAQTRQGEKGR